MKGELREMQTAVEKLDMQIEAMEKKMENVETMVSSALKRKKEAKAKHAELIAKRKQAELQEWGDYFESAGISLRSISKEMMTEIIREVRGRTEEKSVGDANSKAETQSENVGESTPSENMNDEGEKNSDDSLAHETMGAFERRDKKRKPHAEDRKAIES